MQDLPWPVFLQGRTEGACLSLAMDARMRALPAPQQTGRAVGSRATHASACESLCCFWRCSPHAWSPISCGVVPQRCAPRIAEASRPRKANNGQDATRSYIYIYIYDTTIIALCLAPFFFPMCEVRGHTRALIVCVCVCLYACARGVFLACLRSPFWPLIRFGCFKEALLPGLTRFGPKRHFAAL